VILQRSGSEVHVWDSPEIADCLLVKSDLSEVGFGSLVSNTRSGGLGNNQLGHGVLVSLRELEIIWLKSASFTSIHHLTTDEKVNPSVTDVWGLGVSEVKGEDVPGVLASN